MEQNTATLQLAKPDPTEPDRIAALEQRVAELEERFAGLHIATATALELLRPSAEPPAPTASRRVVQIAFDAVDAETSALIALCSDGSLWCLQACSTDWTELPAIPQP